MATRGVVEREGVWCGPPGKFKEQGGWAVMSTVVCGPILASKVQNSGTEDNWRNRAPIQ
jgi:hypothetical protein